jgi:hypothetical protein
VATFFIGGDAVKSKTYLAATVLLSFALIALITSVGNTATINVPLNYNFNGIWHGSGELMDPVTEVSGFRSISDRALDFSNGVPADDVLDNYVLIGDENTLDTVHLGNRNGVDGGNWTCDDVPDGDTVGVQPDWLADPDQTGPPATTTNLAPGILLDANSQASIIFQVSNGGGDFDVRFGFSGGTDVVATLGGGDWFGGNGLPAGAFALSDGTGQVDAPTPDAPLGLWEGVVDLSAEAGRTLTSISFENQTNTSAGYGIYAANVEAIPEPSSLALAGLAIGLLGFTIGRRR